MPIRVVLLVLIWSACFSEFLSAQPAVLHRVNTDAFPEIEVLFRDRNPVLKDSVDFRLLENGKALNFTISSAQDSAGGTRDVLILLEYPAWPEYQAQIAFYKNLLEQNAPYLAGKGGRLRLATFDWTRADGKVLQWVQQEPTDDANELKRILRGLSSPQASARRERSTEIYPALAEAMDFMGTAPKEGAAAILILSAEFSNIYNDKYDDAELIAAGRRKDIPVYALRYPRMAKKYSLGKVCEGTYGLHEEVLIDNPAGTNALFRALLDTIVPRSKGREYTLRFTTSQASGTAMQAELMLSAAESMVIRWQKPGLIETINRRPWLWALLLLPAGLMAWLVWRMQQQRKQRDAALRAEQEARLDAMKKENDAEKAHQEAIREQEKKRAREMEEAARQKAQWDQRMAALQHLQRQPKLVNAAGQSLLISEPEWTFGRADGNHLIVDSPDVSRFHARILFGACVGLTDAQAAGRFFLEDLGSSNGTAHNGQMLKAPACTELHSGDAIGIGQQKWFFYL